MSLNSTERLIMERTQRGLPLTARPFDTLAEELKLSSEEIKSSMKSMLDRKAIRRIAAVPNHYKIGYHANGMSVWDVPDDKIEELGQMVGNLDYVSHCYERPRHLPYWSYNLFAMVHGKSRDEVEDKVKKIEELLKPYVRSHEILYSRRILKKTGFRMRKMK
jgi:DNA-binding Lrp family transcriptional regulator